MKTHLIITLERTTTICVRPLPHKKRVYIFIILPESLDPKAFKPSNPKPFKPETLKPYTLNPKLSGRFAPYRLRLEREAQQGPSRRGLISDAGRGRVCAKPMQRVFGVLGFGCTT